MGFKSHESEPVLRVVTFDAGDTLLHRWVHKTQRFAYLCEKAGYPLSDQAAILAAAKTCETYFQNRCRTPDYATRSWWISHNVAGLQAAGVTADVEGIASRIYDIMTRLPSSWVLDPDVPWVLKQLRQRGLRLAVVSNWDGSLTQTLVDLQIEGYFDYVADSTILGMKKPNPDIYRITCSALGVTPEVCLHVGDSPDADVAMARALNAKALLYDPLGCLNTEGRSITRLSELLESRFSLY